MNVQTTSFAARSQTGPAHDLLCSYGERYNTRPDHGSATLMLMVDDVHMLRLRALPQAGVQISAWLRALPDAGYEREQLLLAAGKVAAGLIASHAAHCVIDHRERALWLQQLTPAHSLQDIDDAVGALVNALAAWKPLIGKA